MKLYYVQETCNFSKILYNVCKKCAFLFKIIADCLFSCQIQLICVLITNLSLPLQPYLNKNLKY